MAGHCDCADSTTLRPFQIPFECERGRAHFTCVTACARGPPADTRGNNRAAENAGGGSHIGSSLEGREGGEEGAVLGGGGALAKAAERAEQRLREEERQRAEEEKRRKEEEEAAELAAREAHNLKGDDLLLEATSFLEGGEVRGGGQGVVRRQDRLH